MARGPPSTIHQSPSCGWPVGGQWVASGWPVGGQWVASGPPVTSHHGDHCFSFAGTIAGNKEVETLLPQGLLETATDSGSK